MRTAHIQVKEMYTVVYVVLCWGPSLRGHHIVFHVDNDVVFNTSRSKTIKSAATMKFVRHLISLACLLDFSFSSEWLLSSLNSIADAASCFSFTHMFEIAPWLNQKPCLKRLQLGCISKINSTLKASHFNFGTDSLQTLAAPIPLVNANFYSTSSSTASTTQTVPSCQHQNPPSSHGSPVLGPGPAQDNQSVSISRTIPPRRRQPLIPSH